MASRSRARAQLCLLLGAAAAWLGCNAISGLGDYEVVDGPDTVASAGAGASGSGGCSAASDCPTPAGLCDLAACEAGVCGSAPAEAGQPSSHQTPGDCKVLVCDAQGKTSTEVDGDDGPDDGNQCTQDLCDPMGKGENPALPAGSPCTKGGKVCDGSGACVECNADADCTMGACASHKCVPISCTDGMMNGDETALDCGGGQCAPCKDGRTCVEPSDCASGVCTNGACQVPTCTDTVKNGPETGTDCGGGCPACPAGMGCGSGGDCQSGVCVLGLCQAPACNDGVKNGGETALDCGGGCPGCGDGQPCNADPDCASTWCSGSACHATLSIQVEGHAPVVAKCNGGDYSCEAHAVCNGVSGLDCVHQDIDCCGIPGSWYPPDGQSGGYNLNFAYAYDFCPAAGDYGNICACNQALMSMYGLAANHAYCGLGHWQLQ